MNQIEKTVSLKKVIITEFLISLITGAVPLYLTVRYTKGGDIVDSLSSMSRSDPIILYFCYLFIFNMVVFLIKKYLLNGSKPAIRNLHKFTHQIGFSIHSVYRVIAGAVPFALLLKILEVGTVKGAAPVTLASMILAGGSLIACCILSQINEVTAPKSKPFGENDIQ